MTEFGIMTEADLIREVYPHYTLKLLARLMNAPFGTARHWLYVRFSPDRRAELASKLLRELDEQDRRQLEREQRRIVVRQRLQAMVNDGERAEMGDAGTSLDIGETRLARAARRLAEKAAEG